MGDDEKKLLKNLGLLAGGAAIGYKFGKMLQESEDYHRKNPLLDFKAMLDSVEVQLVRAAISGNIPQIQVLLSEGVDINTKSAGEAILIWAGRSGQKTVVEFLLNRGADVNTREEVSDSTVLMKMSGQGRKDIVEVLLTHGANINAKDRNDWTALMYAIKNNQENIVELLSTYGADTNVKDKEGWTPLIIAVIKRNRAIVQALLNNGADVNTQMQIDLMKEIGEDITNPNTLIERGMECLGDRGLKDKLHSMLMDTGGNIGKTQCTTIMGINALMAAIILGHVAIVRDLLDMGATTRIENVCNHDIVLFAIGEGNLPIIRELLDKGIDVDIKGERGQKALLTAVLKDDPAIVKILIDRGVNLNEKDEKGNTILTIAEEFSRKKTANILRKFF